MLTKEQKEQFDNAYKLLPPNLKETIDSQETAKSIFDIGKKYGLHIDQLGVLANTVHFFILGLVRADNFSSQIKSSIGVSDDIANLIVYDLNQQIFSKIRREMEKSQVPEGALEQRFNSVTSVPKQEVEVKPQTGDNKDIRDPYRELA